MSNLKRVTIIRAGTGKKTRLDLEPGTTAKDVLDKVGLDVGYVQTADQATMFNLTDDLFALVTDGEKLVVSPDTPVQGA